MEISTFIEQDKNMKLAMRILKEEKHWSLPNCKQVAMYLDSKGFDGLSFVKTCGKKFGFMDKNMLIFSDMVEKAGGQLVDEYEIELDKIINNVHEYV